jgi:prophage antirepressor-like protein
MYTLISGEPKAGVQSSVRDASVLFATSMDIVSAFFEAAQGDSQSTSVNIRGTMEDPLFHAHQVGKVLGIAPIRDHIRDFDSQEKTVIRTDTPGGPQGVVYLTEHGLLRLLYTSTKPVAARFRDLMANVMTELRTKGRYDHPGGVNRVAALAAAATAASAAAAPVSLEIPPPAIAIQDVRTHRPGDKLVLQYSHCDDDDTCALVATHAGLREAARAVDGAIAHCIANAARSNTMYCNYRWMMVPRGTVELPSLPPTESPRHRKGVVAQLTKDRASIVALHANQVMAAKAVGLRCSGSITLAIKNQRTAGEYCWAWYDDLSEDLREAHGSAEVSEEPKPRGKPVHQLHADTLELVATFQNLSLACREIQGSHRKLHEACVTGLVYKGHRWEAAGEL